MHSTTVSLGGCDGVEDQGFEYHDSASPIPKQAGNSVSGDYQRAEQDQSVNATDERSSSSADVPACELEALGAHTPLKPFVQALSFSGSNPSDQDRDALSDEYTTPSFYDDSPFDQFGPILSLNDANELEKQQRFPSIDDPVPFPMPSLNNEHPQTLDTVASAGQDVANNDPYISVSDPYARTLALNNTLSPDDMRPLEAPNSFNGRSSETQSFEAPLGTLDHERSQTPTQKRTGIDPEARQKLNQASVPSLEDQERDRQRAATSAQVTQWLHRTETEQEERNTAFSQSVNGEDAIARVPSITSEDADGNPINALGIHQHVVEGQESRIPGPGVLVHEDETYWYDEDDDSELDDTTPPATPRRLNALQLDSALQVNTTKHQNNDVHPFRKPWFDSPVDQTGSGMMGQPLSSMAAIVRFEQQSKDIETASRTATIASSRRRSEADLDSLFSAAGVSVRVPQQNRAGDAEDVTRRTSLLERMIPRRSSSNLRKRKESKIDESTPPPTGTTSPRQNQGPFPSLRRMSSKTRSRSKSPQPPSQPSSPPMPHSATLAPSSGPWSSVTNVIKRTRSKSELSSKGGIGIAQMWSAQGGPPLLKPPAHHVEEPQEPVIPDVSHNEPRQSIEGKDDDDLSAAESVEMPITLSGEDIAPTYEGFKSHVQRVNSDRLEPYLVERITKEQLTRYRKLAEDKMKHNEKAKRFACSAGERCFINGSPKELPPRSSNRAVEAPIAFHVPSSNNVMDKQESSRQGSTVPANFPDGVPLPPVGRLPAQFECPYCFKVKEFSKPSDWTKHVHEDLQPFTCTFPNCQEPKSFKRKADWVRHENERHRHLERWECDFPDCAHVCYRRDNFVHHLEREHKLPEPRVRTNKATRGPSALSEENGIVAMLVEKCRHETTKKAREEPCRFCGNYLATWKKLTVHLAKHLEQISLPVLQLVNQLNPEQDTIPRVEDFEQNFAQHQHQPQADSVGTYLVRSSTRIDSSTSNTRGRSKSAVETPESDSWNLNTNGSISDTGYSRSASGLEAIPFTNDFHMQDRHISPYSTAVPNYYGYQLQSHEHSMPYDVSGVSPARSTGEASVHHTPQPPSSGFDNLVQPNSHMSYSGYSEHNQAPTSYPYTSSGIQPGPLPISSVVQSNHPVMHYGINTTLPQSSESDFAYSASPLAFNSSSGVSSPYHDPHQLSYNHLASHNASSFGNRTPENYSAQNRHVNISQGMSPSTVDSRTYMPNQIAPQSHPQDNQQSDLTDGYQGFVTSHQHYGYFIQ